MVPLILKTIESVSENGIPVLNKENRRIIAVQRFRPQDVGRQAVCQAVASEKGAVLALGVVEDSTDDTSSPAPIVLRCGEAMLILAPDGSIRLEGSSFGLRARGRVEINGATVELN